MNQVREDIHKPCDRNNTEGKVQLGILRILKKVTGDCNEFTRPVHKQYNRQRWTRVQSEGQSVVAYAQKYFF